MDVPIFTVRPTVQSRPCDCFTASRSMALELSPCSPTRKRDLEGDLDHGQLVPLVSRILSASTSTWKLSSSARTDVRMATSTDRSDFIRKVSQRAAVLAVDNDAERLEIGQLVRDAYNARSAYAHGSEPSKIDLAELRGVVRRCILTRLILGDPTPAGPLHVLADRALLSHDELQSQIRRPFDEFAQRAGLARGLTRRDHAGRGRSGQTDAPS